MDEIDIYIDDESSIDEEVSLWRAVITQALMDAKSNSKKSSFIKAKKEAISWLLGGADDFLIVCELADLDSEYVMDKAKKALDRGCIWRQTKNNNTHKYNKETPRNKKIKLASNTVEIANIPKQFHIEKL